MIRFVFLLLVFVVGLAGAGLYAGKMHHLRMAVPDQLPPWTESVVDDAGLREGTMTLNSPLVPGLSLGWSAGMPGAEGWRWQVRLEGEGLALRADLTVAWMLNRATLRNGRGTWDLGNVPSQVDAGGLLAVRVLRADLEDLRGEITAEGDLAGELAEAVLMEAPMGGGPVTGVLGRDGAWRLDVTLEGAGGPVRFDLTGQLREPVAELQAEFSGSAVPDELRGYLASVGSETAAGWRAAMPVPLY